MGSSPPRGLRRDGRENENLKQRVATCDWPRLAAQLDEQGYAGAAPLLSPAECEGLISLYVDGKAFRSRLAPARRNFGRGEYQYFAAPLPPLVAELRESFYPPLAEMTNRWSSQFLVSPKRLQLNPQPIGQPIHKCVIARHLVDVQNRLVT
jgi:hypothetical protein